MANKPWKRILGWKGKAWQITQVDSTKPTILIRYRLTPIYQPNVGESYDGRKFYESITLDSAFINESFKDSKLFMSRFIRCKFNSVNFRKTDLRYVSFSECEFVDCDFKGSQITGAAFDSCVISNCDMKKLELKNVRFVDTKVEKTKIDSGQAGMKDFKLLGFVPEGKSNDD